MSKATEIKLGNDSNEAPPDRRRGIRLVSSFPATTTNRPSMNIGVCENLFSESPRKPAPIKDRNGEVATRTFESPGAQTDSVKPVVAGITLGGFLLGGLLGYLFGRRRR